MGRHPTNRKPGPWHVHRALEVCAIVTVLALSGSLAWRIAVNARGAAAWIVVGFTVIFGYILADLASGVVHWLADRFGTEGTPVFGPSFIRPFREHHTDPREITRHGFVETNGNNCLVSTPPLMLVYLLVPVSPGQLLRISGLGLVLFLCLSVFATNQFHKWAHMERPPAVARVLQRAHVILRPEHHDLHHTAPFETHYCITTGWLNRPLEGLRVFQTLERILRRSDAQRVDVELPGG